MRLFHPFKIFISREVEDSKPLSKSRKKVEITFFEIVLDAIVVIRTITLECQIFEWTLKHSANFLYCFDKRKGNTSSCRIKQLRKVILVSKSHHRKLNNLDICNRNLSIYLMHNDNRDKSDRDGF